MMAACVVSFVLGGLFGLLVAALCWMARESEHDDRLD